MTTTLIIIAVVAAIVAAVVIMPGLFDRVTIYEFQRGLRYRKGKFDGVLEPGQYWIYKKSTTVTNIDTRPRFVTVPGQEVLSSDSVSLRVSLAAEFAIDDVAKAVNE